MKKKKPKTVVYDGIIGEIKACRGTMKLGNKTITIEPRQENLLSVQIRLCIGEDNTVIVRSILIMRKQYFPLAKPNDGYICGRPIEPKKIKIMLSKKASQLLSIVP